MKSTNPTWIFPHRNVLSTGFSAIFSISSRNSLMRGGNRSASGGVKNSQVHHFLRQKRCSRPRRRGQIPGSTTRTPVVGARLSNLFSHSGCERLELEDQAARRRWAAARSPKPAARIPSVDGSGTTWVTLMLFTDTPASKTDALPNCDSSIAPNVGSLTVPVV